MKYCSQEMHPPQTSVVSSSKERSELAKALRTTLPTGYQPSAIGARALGQRLSWRIHEDHNSWLGSSADLYPADCSANGSRPCPGSEPRQPHRFDTSDTNAVGYHLRPQCCDAFELETMTLIFQPLN
jgi:hypothetical protein